MSGYVMIYQDWTVEVRLDQVMSSYIRLGLISSCKFKIMGVI